MNLLLNILWIILGGWLVCLEYLVSSLVLMITIIGIPFGVQTIKLAMLGLCPFGCTVETTPSTGGCLNIIMNLIWILCVRRRMDSLDTCRVRRLALHHDNRHSFRKATFQVSCIGSYAFRQADCK